MAVSRVLTSCVKIPIVDAIGLAIHEHSESWSRGLALGRSGLKTGRHCEQLVAEEVSLCDLRRRPSPPTHQRLAQRGRRCVGLSALVLLTCPLFYPPNAGNSCARLQNCPPTK